MATIPELFSLALGHHQAGNRQEAQALYQQILQADPAHSGAYLFLGALAHDAGQHQAALELIRHAIALSPADPAYYYNFGNVLTEQGHRAEAVQAYERALELNPHYARAHNNLGYVLMALERRHEALACFQNALRLDSRSDDALYNMGLVLQDLGDLDGAAQCFQLALGPRPQDAGIWLNLGHALAAQAKSAEAAEHYAQALRLPTDQVKSRWNRGLLRLAQGDFAGGWLDYEHRWGVPGIVKRYADVPRWDGSPFAGKTLLIYAEQGLGDTFQFVRYLPLVKAKGGTVLFECQPSLLPVLAMAKGIDHLFARGVTPPACDFQAPLLSLPGIFGTMLETVPENVPYLLADPERVRTWRERLASVQGFKVGISWQGGTAQKNDNLRSAPLARFSALAQFKGVRLISLQKGHGTEQMDALRDQLGIIDFGDQLDTEGAFTDTAAILMSLDLVVTVDTATAHLAGALGVPAWTVLSYMPDWRWLLDRSDSPWYPTMRLFRQTRPGDWHEVFQRVAVALTAREPQE